MSACTADADHELILSLLYIMRNQKADHIIEHLQKFLCDTVPADIVAHALLEAGMTPKLRIVVGIRQEAHTDSAVRIKELIEWVTKSWELSPVEIK